MVSAAWIEFCSASRTLTCTFQILIYGQLGPAASAKHCRLIPFAAWPDLNAMAGQSRVAIFTGIVDAATFHLYRDDVQLRAVMSAACLSIQFDSAHAGRGLQHTPRIKARRVPAEEPNSPMPFLLVRRSRAHWSRPSLTPVCRPTLPERSSPLAAGPVDSVLGL
jgi:hypothetical protein